MGTSDTTVATEGSNNWHDNWNIWDENWVQNEMTDGHKIELTYCHKSWNKNLDTSWYTNLVLRPNSRVGHSMWSRNWRLCNNLWESDQTEDADNSVTGTLKPQHSTRQLASLLCGMRVDRQAEAPMTQNKDSGSVSGLIASSHTKETLA